MRIFLLSVYFYFSNLFFSLPNHFSFYIQIFEFLTIWLVAHFIASFRYHKIIFSIWLFLYFVSFSYVAFSGHTISSFDICLFFSHTTETFESFIGLFSLFYLPLIFAFIGSVLIYKINKTTPNYRFLVVFLVIIYFVPFTFYDVSLNLLRSVFELNCKSQTINSSKITQLPTYEPKSKQMIIIIGESMRVKNLSLFGYGPKTTPNLDKLKNQLFYKTIYANATNTDVALPLFFNGTQEIAKIDLTNNIFTLARNANFKTHFISAQTNSYLKYIKPYLEEKQIDDLKILNTKNDEDLIGALKNIDLNKSNFVVMQMMGEHSPYKFYEQKHTKFKNDYDNCVFKSDFVLGEVFKYGMQNNIPILFFSDHGEMLGEADGFYGHNRFAEAVYKVPFISYGFEKVQTILSQNDIYEVLKVYLGYQKEPKQTTVIRVNGSMISGEDGFREFKR